MTDYTDLYPERTYGSGYVEVYGQHATAADIARLVRRDLKAAKKDGAFPEGVTFSVRCRNYAGGRAVDVTIKGYEGPVSCPECQGQRNSRTYAGLHGDLCQTCATWNGWMAPEAEELYRVVDMMREAYNYDGSNTQIDYFDVSYYGSTTFDRRYSEVAS